MPAKRTRKAKKKSVARQPRGRSTVARPVRRRAARARARRGPALAPVDVSALRLPECQFVQAHNTYAYAGRAERAGGFGEVVEQLYRAGVRGVELDLHASPRGWAWSVGHDGEYRSGEPFQLPAFLEELDRWSWDRRAAGGHEPMLVNLELKDAAADPEFAVELDRAIAVSFHHAVLFSPHALLWDVGEHLRQVAADPERWPTIGQMRNTLVLCLSGGDEDTLKRYAGTHHELRLCFADFAPSMAPGDPGQFRGPDRMILNLQCGAGGVLGDWRGFLGRAARRRDVLPRVWWEHIPHLMSERIDESVAALDLGAWCVASDSALEVLFHAGLQGFRPRPGL